MSGFLASGISVSYGGVHANRDVTIEVGAGELVGLIGPNGAGKTSFIDAVTGFTRIEHGSIELGGQDLTTSSAAARARAGLVRTFQSLELFEDLDVASNLLAAAETTSWRDVLADIVRPGRERGHRQRVEAVLEQLGLSDAAASQPGDLSHGGRTLVSVARALVMDPAMVLLDEPAAGLDADESASFGQVLRGLVDDGLSCLMVDHDMSLVFSVCDRVYVLDFGRIIASGTSAEVRADPTVIAAYLGEDAPTGEGLS